MEKFKNASLDSLAVLAIASGIGIIEALGEKWYIGVVLVALGAGLSFLKYRLRK